MKTDVQKYIYTPNDILKKVVKITTKVENSTQKNLQTSRWYPG